MMIFVTNDMPLNCGKSILLMSDNPSVSCDSVTEMKSSSFLLGHLVPELPSTR